MTCNEILRAQHKPYPRTCAECGLGPCKQHIPQRATPSSPAKIQAEQKAVIRDLTDACKSVLDRYDSFGLYGPDRNKLIEAVNKAKKLEENA